MYNKILCNDSLTANSNQFYFDYQDGKYGYNTDPNRGADTFNPFSSGFNTSHTEITPYQAVNIKTKAKAKLIIVSIIATTSGTSQGSWIGAIYTDGTHTDSISGNWHYAVPITNISDSGFTVTPQLDNNWINKDMFVFWVE